MASEKVEIVRSLLDAYERADIDFTLAKLDPSVELHEWPEEPDSRTHRGHDGIRRVRESWGEAWEWLRAEPVEIVEAGHRVFVRLHSHGKGRGSSVEVELDTFGVYTFRDSKVVKIEFFTDRDAALRAAGLSHERIQKEAK